MVLTKEELVSALQNEVRIAVHLAKKVEPHMLDYRPTPGQRSTLEVLQYISMMGPTLLRYAVTGSTDPGIWASAETAAQALSAEATIAAIEAQREDYARILADVTDEFLREAKASGGGTAVSRGASIVNLVLCGCAAYRMQLFLYLKSCGRSELNTLNLWAGMDAPTAA
jgi:hypothetical protein